jgi:hypothetical protein
MGNKQSTMGNKKSAPFITMGNETNEQKLMRQLEEMKKEKEEMKREKEEMKREKEEALREKDEAISRAQRLEINAEDAERAL